MLVTEINKINNILLDCNLSFRDQSVLVTGGAGFLGSWICDALIMQGAKVTAIDNFASGSIENISHLLSIANFKFIEHDISKPLSSTINTNFDIIIHMASRASPFEFAYYPIEILNANTIGLVNSLEIARKCDAKILYTSTSEIYGNPSVVPTPETYYGNVNSVGPRGCYDEAKRCGEAYITAYQMQYGIDTRIARIFNTYGPRMRFDGIYGRVIPRFINQALTNQPITIFGNGSQTRSFTYVTDQIIGLLKLIKMDTAKNQVINIGNNIEITINDLATLILKITKSNSKLSYQPLPKDDPLRRNPNISKANYILNWQPTINLSDGLIKTIKYFKRGGEDIH